MPRRFFGGIASQMISTSSGISAESMRRPNASYMVTVKIALECVSKETSGPARNEGVPAIAASIEGNDPRRVRTGLSMASGAPESPMPLPVRSASTETEMKAGIGCSSFPRSILSVSSFAGRGVVSHTPTAYGTRRWTPPEGRLARITQSVTGSRIAAVEEPPPSRFRASWAPSEIIIFANSSSVTPLAPGRRPSTTAIMRVVPSSERPTAVRGAASKD